MITIIDIIRGFSDLLERELGKPPMTKDITEFKPGDRPCSFIEPTDIRRTRESGMLHEEIDLQIVCFAPETHRGWGDLLKVQHQLGLALTLPVEITEDFLVFPEDVDFQVFRDEMYLVCEFTLDNWQDASEKEEEEALLMEELYWKRKEGEDDGFT